MALAQWLEARRARANISQIVLAGVGDFYRMEAVQIHR